MNDGLVDDVIKGEVLNGLRDIVSNGYGSAIYTNGDLKE